MPFCRDVAALIRAKYRGPCALACLALSAAILIVLLARKPVQNYFRYRSYDRMQFPAIRQLHNFQSSANHFVPRESRFNATCRHVGTRYKSSPLEERWLPLFPKLRNREQFCAEVRSDSAAIRQMLGEAQAQAGSPPPLARSSTLSTLTHAYDCGGNRHEVETRIEPLVAALRPPGDFCLHNGFTSDLGYIALQHSSAFQGRDAGVKNILFDLGASNWGGGQNWLVETYRRSGIEFDRILSWEVKLANPKFVFEPLPHDIHHAYQYLNIPASPTPGDPANPLEILKRIARPEDFVSFKLDIDNTKVESEFVKQILEDPQVALLIDEFFFEHHVNFPPLLGAWGETTDMSQTVYDSYILYHTLRSRGIRAHGWP